MENTSVVFCQLQQAGAKAARSFSIARDNQKILKHVYKTIYKQQFSWRSTTHLL